MLIRVYIFCFKLKIILYVCCLSFFTTMHIVLGLSFLLIIFLFPLQVCFSKCICCVTSFICYQIHFSKFYFLCTIIMKEIKLIVVMNDLDFIIKDVAFHMRCSKGPPIVKWFSSSKFGWKNVQWPLNNFFSLYPREKMKKTPSSGWEIFSLLFFGSIEFFLVARHFPTTFGEKIAWRFLYNFPPNYPTWRCMEKHQKKFPFTWKWKGKKWMEKHLATIKTPFKLGGNFQLT